MFIDEATKAGLPWYRALNATQWKTLIASNLGWVFDGFEAFALILTVGLAMRQLLSPADLANLPTYAGGIIALTLIGWAIGGMAAGVVADYIGRKRTMILSILAYSIMTGLSAIAWDWTSFAVMRFLVGLAIGAAFHCVAFSVRYHGNPALVASSMDIHFLPRIIVRLDFCRIIALDVHQANSLP